MKRFNLFINFLYMLVAVLLLHSCSSNNHQVTQGFANDVDAITALRSSPVPDGVDAALYERLRTELIRQLEQREVLAMPADPQAIRPQVQLDPASNTLSWRYRLAGDFDQNGEVNAGDLVPLAMHYGETAPVLIKGMYDLVSNGLEPPFGAATAVGVIDGDSNGELNQGDISVIAANFQQTLQGYRVYSSTDPAAFPGSPYAPSPSAPLIELGFVAANGESGSQRLYFEYQIPSSENGSYWVRPVLGGIEGPPSNVVGEPLALELQDLALVSVSPAKAEPGEMLTLKFSQYIEPYLGGLTVDVNGFVEVSLAAAPFDGSSVFTAMPILPEGTYTLDFYYDGAPIGGCEVTSELSTPTLTVDDVEQAQAELCTDVLEALETQCEAFSQNHTIDLDKALADLDTLSGILTDLQGWVSSKFDALSEDDRQLVLKYLENTNYVESLKLPSIVTAAGTKQTSATWYLSYRNYELDALSAQLTLLEKATDPMSLGISISLVIFPSPLTASAAAAITLVKLLRGIIDGVIDTFCATDIYDLRVSSKTHDFTIGEHVFLNVEGQFFAENNYVVGTISSFIDLYFDALPLVNTDGGVTRELMNREIQDEIDQVVGSKALKAFAEFGLKSPFPDDPTALRVGGEWFPLDLLLYEKTRLIDILAVYDDGREYWIDHYPQDYEPRTHYSVDKMGSPAEILISDYGDLIRFSNDGRHYLKFCMYRLESASVVATAFTNSSIVITPVKKAVPFYAGRYGNWKNVLITDEIASTAGSTICGSIRLDGSPSVLLASGVNNAHPELWKRNPKNHKWEKIKTFGNYQIRGCTSIFQLPTILYYDRDLNFGGWNGCFLLQPTGLESGWPDRGIRVPREIFYEGVITGPSSESILTDESADFTAMEFEPGSLVELTETGETANFREVLDEHRIEMNFIPPGSSFEPGMEYILYRNVVKGKECLAANNGLPGMLYRSWYGAICYSLAEDVEGTSWHPSRIVTDVDNADYYYLMSCGDHPIAFSYNCETGVVMSIRANDENGESWGAPTQIPITTEYEPRFASDGSNTVICYTVLVPIDNPQVYGQYVHELYAIHSLDSSGAVWSDPVLLMRGEERNDYNDIHCASCCYIDGRPAVAVNQGYQLLYSQAASPEANIWGEFEPVYHEGFALLSDDGGSPIIYHTKPGIQANTEVYMSVPELE